MYSKKAIIYDSTCPMCKLYTSAFVKNGLLTEECRISFAELNKDIACTIDFDKGRHEIPLVDLEGGQTIYGLDSMVFLLNRRFKIIGAMMKVKPIYWFFKKLYSVVSYNRRVIAPSKKQLITFDCTPDFNLKHRLFYCFFALIVSAVIIGFFSHFITNTHLFATILAIVISLILSIFFFLKGELAIEYLGQIATTLLIGSLILIPAFIFPNFYIIIGSISVLTMLTTLIKRFWLLFS